MKALLIAALAASSFVGVAAAEPAYTADELLDKFLATRGLCIGTEEDCGNRERVEEDDAIQDLVVTFDLDSADLTPSAKENLDEFVGALRNPMMEGAMFAVEGHTDARGDESYNLTLSQRRAEAVVAYVQQQGADTSNMTVAGLGMSKPRTSDPFDAENRRVEARIVGWEESPN